MRGARLAIASVLLVFAGCGTRSVMRMAPPPPTYAWQSFDSAPADARAALRTNGTPARGADPGSGRGGDWARLPAPHRAPKTKTPVATPTTLTAARALIGWRDPRSSLGFALAVAGGLADASAPPDVADGPALVTWAEPRGALAPITPGAADVPTVAAGDLLIFDRAVADAPASLVAVVLDRDARGVIEILYLAGGVIRRGHVDPTRPKTARDRDRRVANTYLRHGTDHPPKGTRFLAGELAAARVRLPPR